MIVIAVLSEANDVPSWYLSVLIFVYIYMWYPSSSNICVYLYIMDMVLANDDQPVCNFFIRLHVPRYGDSWMLTWADLYIVIADKMAIW